MILCWSLSGEEMESGLLLDIEATTDQDEILGISTLPPGTPEGSVKSARGLTPHGPKMRTIGKRNFLNYPESAPDVQGLVAAGRCLEISG